MRMMAVSKVSPEPFSVFEESCEFCGNEECSCLDPNINPDSPDYGNVILTVEEWEHHFNPLVNHLDKNASFDDGSGGTMFETYGAEYDYVAAIGQKEPNRIWTYIDNEEGETVIINHWAFANRIGYFITEKPYDELLNIIVQLDKE
jgi:hypothetical protein